MSEGWPELPASESPAWLMHKVSPLTGQTSSQGWSTAIGAACPGPIMKHGQGWETGLKVKIMTCCRELTSRDLGFFSDVICYIQTTRILLKTPGLKFLPDHPRMV